MTRNQIILRPPGSSSNRRKPLLSSSTRTISSSTSRETGKRFAEVAGGTAAECAVVCCCCPCGLMNLLYMAIYKVPASLCRKIMRKRRRKRLVKRGLLPQPSINSSTPTILSMMGGGAGSGRKNFFGCDDIEMYISPSMAARERDWFIMGSTTAGGPKDGFGAVEKELMELEKQMWEQFYSTGFWRSPSQRRDNEDDDEQDEEEEENRHDNGHKNPDDGNGGGDKKSNLISKKNYQKEDDAHNKGYRWENSYKLDHPEKCCASAVLWNAGS